MVTANNQSDDAKFFRRIARALDLKPEALARRMGVGVRELEEISLAGRAQLVGLNDHPMWHGLYEYVSKRMAELLAVREELQRKLAADRRKQLMRRMETTDR